MKPGIKIDTIYLVGEKNIELKDDFIAFAFKEDIESNMMTGILTIGESKGIREDLHIKGEEQVKITFCSISQITYDEHDKITLDFWVSKITDHTNIQDRRVKYDLHLHTIDMRINMMSRLRRSYSGTANSIVSNIVSNFFAFPLVETDGDRISNDYVFPNWKPYQAINFLATNTISNSFNDSDYLFYQDRDGYHFVSLSYLMNKSAWITIENQLMSNDEKEVDLDNVFHAEKLDAIKLFDVDSNLLNGMYGSTLVTYDKLNKRYNETTETYSGCYDQFTHVANAKLTKKLNESVKNNYQFMIRNDEDKVGCYEKVEDIHKQRIIRFNQLKHNMWSVELNGNSNLKVGTCCNLDLRSRIGDEGTGGEDTKLSGKYLIKSIESAISLDSYTSQLILVKDGYKE